ncbi:MAG TPA: carbon-nitrogen hydrolase family protein [Candidatus Hydrogenedentes bacterium]|nr:carbon-nitrogen hydrolase family protein [Candidatus Hydrogenedentota bacterium]HQE83260.1 carbon-nitrogen hydrolase family protein [Candidatus Hydrogenedentota bacterium]HQH53186.1 carbon-nitrogen hydrolase family protein [Candidatus Hydrogenedentota bacterium]HQM47177.1 carbon-nitrogen hydrolase family protein [Candidatus Hydrogenedentota bacterium]
MSLITRPILLIIISMLVVAPLAQPEDLELSPGKFTVALLQMESHGNDQEKNLKKASFFCQKAAEMGADLALMPEIWSIGYTRPDGTEPETIAQWQAQAIGRDSAWVRHFADLAKELEIAIGVTYLEKWDGPPRNTLSLFDRHGKQVLTYAKVHTSDFKPMERNCTPGDDWPVAELDTENGPVKIGAMICFDRESPESARILMLNGAEIILTPNCCKLDDMRLQQFRIRAVENAVGVAMTNYPAPHMNGQSVAYDAAGEVVVHAGASEGLYLAPFDLDAIREKRAKTIWGNAYRRPHRYGRITDTDKEEIFERIDGMGNPYNAAER